MDLAGDGSKLGKVVWAIGLVSLAGSTGNNKNIMTLYGDFTITADSFSNCAHILLALHIVLSCKPNPLK